jgi:L-fuconolactonase
MLDSHQHFWQIDRGDYSWMGPHVAPLLRDFLPADLHDPMRRAGVTRTVVIQAAQTQAETDFLLALAASTDCVAGVVGWLDLDAPGFADTLGRYRSNPWLVGLRPMLQELDDDAWILRPRVLENLRLIAASGLAFDVLSFPRHLPYVIEALQHTPGLRAVIDHLSKPPIAAIAGLGAEHPDFRAWAASIDVVASLPGVHCKVSGMVTEASADWALRDFRAYVDVVATAFGPERLMFGSDWPVCTLAASYAEVQNIARTLLGHHFGPVEMEAVFEGNAARFYRV